MECTNGVPSVPLSNMDQTEGIKCPAAARSNQQTLTYESHGV